MYFSSSSSHKSGKFSDRKSKKLTITGNPGDLIIWDSRLWHGTSENLTTKQEAVVITYGAWWLKPSMDITKSYLITFIKNVLKYKSKF